MSGRIVRVCVINFSTGIRHLQVHIGTIVGKTSFEHLLQSKTPAIELVLFSSDIISTLCAISTVVIRDTSSCITMKLHIKACKYLIE